MCIYIYIYIYIHIYIYIYIYPSSLCVAVLFKQIAFDETRHYHDYVHFSDLIASQINRDSIVCSKAFLGPTTNNPSYVQYFVLGTQTDKRSLIRKVCPCHIVIMEPVSHKTEINAWHLFLNYLVKITTHSSIPSNLYSRLALCWATLWYSSVDILRPSDAFMHQ